MEDKSRQHVLLDNSRSEQQAGINVSYENSLSVIRRDIRRETIDRKHVAKPPKLAISIKFDPIEEKNSNRVSLAGKVKQSLKYSNDKNASMNEYLSRPSPKNQTAQINVSN
jgi:hypothetical protein